MFSKRKIFALTIFISLKILISQDTIRFIKWGYKNENERSWKDGVPKIISKKGDSDYDSLKDPLRGYGLKQAQEYEAKNWEIKSDFKLENTLKNEQYELVVEGISPYSKVYINNSFVFESGNYFLKYRLVVDQFLKHNEFNEIRIELPSPVLKAIEEYKADKINYPSDNEDGNKKVSQFLRMPPMSFGWDICPRLLPDRIPKEIFIRKKSAVEIQDIFVSTEKIEESKAELKIEVKVYSSFTGEFKVSCDIEKNRQSVFNFSDKLVLKKGLNTFQKTIRIKNPELWWPNGYSATDKSASRLYDVMFKITGKNESSIKKAKFGIRKINLIREKDVFGEGFYFSVNGENIFMKGANYLPDMMNFQNVNQREKFSRLINLCKDANFNMLRVWGGGNYLSEEELSICDEAGILIWQDFIFSGTMYSPDEKFLGNIQKEAEEQVIKYRKHPCTALWCGNNEIEVAWNNWGWQDKYNIHGKDSVKLIRTYDKIFKEILPNAVSKFDSGTSYISTSPISNWGKEKDFLSGDNHYWGVWHGELPIESFEKKIPRFMSEYGLPSVPSEDIIEQYFSAEKKDIKDSAIQSRMRSYKGISLLEKYIEAEFGRPKDFKSFVLLSQLVQAEAYRKAIVNHRLSKPFCMGTLFWQLNDAWPGISWSVLDYDLNEKPVWKAIKESYEPIIIALKNNRGKIEIHGVSDLKIDTNITLRLQIKNINGKRISDTSLHFIIKSETSSVLFSKEFKELIKENYIDSTLIILRNSSDNKIIEVIQSAKIKSNFKSQPKINIEGTQMKIKSDSYFKNGFIQYLNTKGKEAYFLIKNIMPEEINIYDLPEDYYKGVEFISQFELINLK
ncbi:MAG: beta-mannosidase [Bacteroidota bacterium]